jgi:FkbM family methyltransferase
MIPLQIKLFRLRIRSKLFRYLFKRLLRIRAIDGLSKVGSGQFGWIVPLPMLSSRSICYLAGVGEDISFDIELAEKLSCDIHSFDPTPRAAAHIERTKYPSNYTFHPYGLWSSDETLKFYAPRNEDHVSHSILNLQETFDYFEGEVKSLKSTMSELGHHSIDLLKLDIEGAEYETLGQAIRDDIDFDILCVEFDQPYPFRKTLSFVRKLKASGLEPVSLDGWNVTFVRRSAMK